jgi:hypothetical protein
VASLRQHVLGKPALADIPGEGQYLVFVHINDSAFQVLDQAIAGQCVFHNTVFTGCYQRLLSPLQEASAVSGGRISRRVFSGSSSTGLTGFIPMPGTTSSILRLPSCRDMISENSLHQGAVPFFALAQKISGRLPVPVIFREGDHSRLFVVNLGYCG